MAQFVQGFVKNILDERNLDNREFMLQYLGDIMEDTSDFHGLALRHVTQFYSAKWRGEKFTGQIRLE